jgi:flagellar basal-body rod protein FlgG
MRALNTAATGMQAQQLNVDVISNNIANINSTSYQRQRAEFMDLLYQTQRNPGSASSDTGSIIPTGVQIGLGVNTGSVYRINEQGELQQTSNPTDIAIKGKGYFRVELPDGTFSYTRAGSFQMSPTGEIVNAKGYLVSPGIIIPNNSSNVTINDSGQVSATLPGAATPQILGQFDMIDFPNPAGLFATGDNQFIESAASGAPTTGVAGVDGLGKIIQGWLETSNVDPVREITSLITAQRGYELNSKVIKAGDEMLQTVNNSKQ